jgi:hypothetical protein
LFKHFVRDAEQLRVEGEGHVHEKLCVSRSATEQQWLCSPPTWAAVMEEQGKEVGDVVEVEVGVDDSLDVGGPQPTIDQSLKTAGTGVEENTVVLSRLKEVAGRSAARVEFDGSRTQNGEAHG